MRSRWQRLILAVVSGLLGLAAFPSVSLGWLAWIALAPLLIAVSRSRTSRESFVLGVVAGLIQWAGLLAWIPRVLMLYGGVPAYLAWMLELLLAAVLALYPAVACAATRLCLDAGGRRLLLVFPFVWVALEWLRTHILLGGFPWLLLGYSQTEWFTLVQIADLTGVFGVSFLVAGVNAAAAWSWIHRSRGVRSLGPAAAAVLMVAVALAYGQVMRARWSGTETPYRAAMLQGNLGFEDPYPALAWKFQEGYARMLETLGAQPIDLLLLPEAPAARSFQDDAEHRNAMARLASRAARGMVLNNVHRDGAGRAAAYYNSAYVLSPSGTEVGRYDKIHLVPFGEYVPWRDLFSFAEPITKDVGA
ncbi:MAG: apolipoprotein N-acyltransferase, partial [Acidobacteria bacterium]|nr:apolipoprotein N-acyltransferase [Acidobacteriota bacterium]